MILDLPSDGESKSATQTRASTLVELLTSMAILSVLLVVLGTTLGVSLDRFRTGVDRTESFTSMHSAITWIQKDLSSSISERPANVSILPDGATATQIEFFANKVFLPFEVDRKSGDGSRLNHPVSLPNAAPEFGSLVFASLSQAPGYVSSASNQGPELHPAIVGYYVAYTLDSPLAGDTRASMKLFRHYRPGGTHLGAGYSRGFLTHVSQVLNDTHDETGSVRGLLQGNPALIRIGQYSNQLAPSLLGFRTVDFETFEPIEAPAPWPVYPVADRLRSPPPSLYPDRGDTTSWTDPDHMVHDTVFPDEPVCENIVRFELKPLRKVTLNDGTEQWMDAVAINQHLQLPGGNEWPCLVQPDVIEITLTTIDPTTAEKLPQYQDWIIDWSRPISSGTGNLESLVRQNARERIVRVPARLTF